MIFNLYFKWNYYLASLIMIYPYRYRYNFKMEKLWKLKGHFSVEKIFILH